MPGKKLKKTNKLVKPTRKSPKDVSSNFMNFMLNRYDSDSTMSTDQSYASEERSPPHYEAFNPFQDITIDDQEQSSPQPE